MKHNLSRLLPYLPWLLLLLGWDAFLILLLWLAEVQALRSLAAVILLATLFLFFFLCAILIRQSRKREQAFRDFLERPDSRREEQLCRLLPHAQSASVRQLGQALESREEACRQLRAQMEEYQEYVEAWAHEAKTPLSLLTLVLDNRREELPAALCFRLDYIRSHLQNSVEQMLFYARLKSPRKDYLLEHLPLRDAVEEVLEDYQPLLEEKGFQVHLLLPPGTSVCADRRGLWFLLGQILRNSIQYSSPEPQLWLRWEDVDPEGLGNQKAAGNQKEAGISKENCPCLEIRDNGPGVRACDLPYVFEKGFTGSSDSRGKRATGMGLYLAREIGREMNLTLEAESQWGQGFILRVFFPVVRE